MLVNPRDWKKKITDCGLDSVDEKRVKRDRALGLENPRESVKYAKMEDLADEDEMVWR